MFKIAYHPIYVYPVPDKHRFPMEKYELLPLQLIHQGIVNEKNFFEPSLDKKYDFSIHNKDYLNRLINLELTKKEERASGFKLSKKLVDREICITNGTIEVSVSAMKDGIGFNIAGGTHHAFSNRPEGFCLLNDQAIASMHLLNKGLVKRVLIVDLDVHQGNGTAEILANESRVFTFSMHGLKNYPNNKPKSDLDIALDDNIKDSEYLKNLRKYLPQIIEKHKPNLIFYQSGVDVLKTDKLGRLSLSLAGCKERDNIVYENAKSRNIAVVTTMGGGYSEDIKYILEAHCNTFKSAIKHFK